MCQDPELQQGIADALEEWLAKSLKKVGQVRRIVQAAHEELELLHLRAAAEVLRLRQTGCVLLVAEAVDARPVEAGEPLAGDQCRRRTGRRT